MSEEKHVWSFSRRRALWLLSGAALAVPLLSKVSRAGTCKTTFTWNSEGPFYLEDARPDEPTGSEIALLGTVSDKLTCEPIAGARIVRWHTNKHGIYDEYFNTVLESDPAGKYRVETIVPGQYNGVPRHVHFMILAPGYHPLTTRWQVLDSESPSGEIPFDFVLEKT